MGIEVPIKMECSPLRATCFICGEEIQPTLWRVRLATKLPAQAHEGCFTRAVEARWRDTKDKNLDHG